MSIFSAISRVCAPNLAAQSVLPKESKTPTDVKTIYCIALEGNQVTGVNWYHSAGSRDEMLGATGAEIEITFEMTVPVTANADEITDLADQAAWNKTYVPSGAPIARGESTLEMQTKVSVSYLLSNMAVTVQCHSQAEQDAVKRFAKEGGFACPAPAGSRPVYACIAKTHPGGEILWG